VAANIKIEDLRRVIIEDARKIEKKYREAVKQAAREEVGAIYNSAITNIMLRLQSGNHPHANELLQSMYIKPLDTSGYRWEIGNTFQWAAALEYGTKPHSIDAAPGEFLVFEVPIIYDPRRRTYARVGYNGGFVVYAKHVDHPGAKPYLFLAHAFLDNKNTFEKKLDKYIKEISL